MYNTCVLHVLVNVCTRTYMLHAHCTSTSTCTCTRTGQIGMLAPVICLC